MNFQILVYSFFILLLFNGYIFADVMNFDSLQEAISSEELDKKYSFSGTEIVENDLGQLMGNSLTIEGIQQGSIIKAKESDICGITITGKQNLILNNISGFNNFQTAIYNYYGSSVTVNNTVFNGNKGALKGSAISNNGYLEVNNSTFSLNSSSYGGALINIYGEASLNNVWFENNSAKTGGAILNDVFNGIMHINNVIFSNNVATGVDGKYGGGAIKNKNILTITGNSLFNDNESGISGGAIENRFHASLNINGFIEFVENKASSVGGAIYNCENSSATISGEKIIFSSNSAGNAGGAIFNNDNSKMAIGSDSGSTIFFSSNTATGSAGGAICNFEKSEIAIKGEKIIFSSNTAQTAGGAIDNTQSIMIISGENIIFSSNTAGDAGGGAIFNYKMISSSTMTITGKNVVFNYNIATSSGGAIYNEGSIINLLSTGNIEFTGNKANEISNAIHDVGGIINLSASDNAKIIFNDRITTENSNSILNINQSTSTLNAIGTIVLNEDMSGYTGQVNLYNGEIELQSNTLDTSNVNTNKFFNGDITLSSGTLNILNNSIDNIKIDSLTSTANANLKFDVDLSNNTSDNFTIANNTTGELNLTAINIIAVNEERGQITLFNDEKSPALNILTTANYGGYEYTFTNSSDTLGVLNYEQTGTTRTFKEVVNDVVPGYRSYSLAGNETVIEDLGDLGGTLLTIFGNGKNIEGNNVDGISVGSVQTLNIENVNSWSGFTGENGALKNEGTLNISGTNFSNNNDKDIINNGNLILSGLASSFEKGVIGTGTTTVKGVDITLNNAKLEQSKIEINESGSLITSATNIVGDIENNGILIFNGGTNNNKISGEGTLVVNDSILNYAGISQKNINITNGFFSNYASEDITVATLRVEVNAVLYENGYNGGKINAEEIYNNGFISIIHSDITSTSDYQGYGELILTETKFINNANIVQSTITINYASSLTTDADKINAIIVNEGRLTLAGGENNNYIFGIGTTTIDGSVVNNSIIENRVIINETNELITSATNIVGDIENNGNLVFTGGTNNNKISGEGTLVINNGRVVNNSTIENRVIIDETNELITSATNVVGDIENNGNLVFTGGTNNNKISGEGTLVVNSSILNYAGILQKDINITNGFFSNYASEDIVATTLRVGVNAVLYENGYNGGKINAEEVYNDGFISIIQSDITNTSDYQGYGELILTETNFINNANIKQSTITINYVSSLITDANKVNAKILNEGTLILTGGENSNYIFGKGTTTIDGSVVNNSTIENRVIINKTNELITSATNVIGDIENDGNLVFNGGEINNNKITGSGLLNITSADIINNNKIEQSKITISGTKFTNNSIIKTTDFNLNSVDFKLTEKGDLTVENLSAQNSTIDMANSILKELNIGKLTVNGAFNLSVDADLANKKMDTISANNYSGNGKINVKTINILSDTIEDKTEILFTSSTVLQDKITTIKTASSNLYKYGINYNDGYLTFIKTGNNQIKTQSQVATAVGGTISQTVILNQAFTSIDSAIQDRYISYYEASNRKNKKKSSLYASTADLLYSEDTNTIEKGLWIRPYAIQDTININNLSVDNTAIGTLAGLDLSVWENSLLSFYIGYAGSTQKYENIKINQIGYVVGTTGMIIKDYYYLGLTANINFNKTQSENDNGTDELDMNMYSVGAKAGYNIYLGEKLILEPNLTLMYGKINSSEYTTKISNKKIGSQSTNNILIEPQIKAKLDLAKGWTPYTLLGYVLNAGEKTKLIVDNSSFDDMDMQITGYTEYGIGVTKSFKYSAWSCSLQIVGKSGNREGFGSNLEIKYRF